MNGFAATAETTRREQAIAHGADLLCEAGPSALTSVAVAERMGITQSAVYRHVRNMDELSRLATELVVEWLNQSAHDMSSDRTLDGAQIEDVHGVCRAFIQQVVGNQRSFDVVARWRFADGHLGIGIRRIVAESHDILATRLEARWRIEFGEGAPLGPQERDALRAHALALLDDGLAMARLVGSVSSTPLELDDVVVILTHRLIAGWAALVIDLHARVGWAFPQIDLTNGIVAR